MNTTQPATSQRHHDHGLLAAGHDTGWWDDQGGPAPWPEDYWLPDGTINPDRQTNSHNQTEEPAPATASENHNF
ncbi:hypothetical protein B5P43_32805 [Bacillus sp. SRB_336]|nr:hypothetical protein B5P43_32805 [Bacillus sp. SRB_336]